MTSHPDYSEFLSAKAKTAPVCGYDVEHRAFHPRLKDHQRAICRWAVRGGRRAMFTAFGLGKTGMQLETVRETLEHCDGDAVGLIIMPLGVRREFIAEAKLLDTEVRFIRGPAEIDRATCRIYLTNYETVRDGRLDPSLFAVASLDEASVLRSFGSKTYQTFLTLFDAVPHRFVATATPSPNRLKELIHYAGFLGIMDTGQSLTRWFQRNSEKANDLKLYPHKEREFWLWCNTWAVFLQRPSDLGFSDEGYDLPPLDLRYHEVQTRLFDGSFERDGQGVLIRSEGASVVAAAHEKRDSIALRVERAAAIVEETPGDHFVLWHDLEDERAAIEKRIVGTASVYGAQDLDAREEIVAEFCDGRRPILAGKPIMLGSGTNMQRHCHRAVFVGVTAKFNDFIQAVHRLRRFGQPHPVRIDIVHTDQERETLRILSGKWAQHEEMMATMSEIIRSHGLEQLNMADEMRRAIGVTRREASGDGWHVANNDCVEETRAMADGSVDLIVTSIPFANHYEYTPSYNDFGHTDDNDHFWRQMDFLTPELFRVLEPGRIAAIHVKDRILFGNVTGYGRPAVSPFHAEGIFHFKRHGFVFCGMITVVTDVVFENNGTYRLSYSEMAKDGSKMGVGSPEYVLLFFKPQTDRSKGYADERITKDKADYSLARWQIDAHAFWRSSGDRVMTAAELAKLPTDVLARIFPKETLKGVYDYRDHVEIGEVLEERQALPTTFMALAPGSADPDVWHDVVRMRTLNGAQAAKGREKHVCLARGSLVLTRRGYLPIEAVEVGDEVLTHLGRWRRVLVAAQTGISPVVDLRAQGVAALKLTPDHKLWTRKSDWARARDGALRAMPEWVRADATVGGYVNLKLPPVEDSSLTVQECWLLGRWLADGHVGARGEFVVSVGPDKLADFLEHAGKHAGHQAVRTAVQVRLKSLSDGLVMALDSAGRGAAEKQVPAHLLSLPVHKATALLEGYLSGDGHLVPERETWMATSISRALLLGMAMLAQRAYGTVANLRPGRPAGTTVIEGRTVVAQQEWILSFDQRWDGRRKTPFILQDGAWKRVRAAEPAGEAETWCLRVEEDESFTAEGCIVKNCPLQFDIVDRLIERYSMKGETVFDPFGGLFTVPYCAMALGRRGAAVELNDGYFRDGVRILEAQEQRLAVPTLFQLMDAPREAAE